MNASFPVGSRYHLRRNQHAQGKFAYFAGILVSLVGHLLLAVISIIVLEARASGPLPRNEVFTVTLEGGEKLGGFTNVPEENSEKQKPPLEPPGKTEAEPVESSEKPEVVEKKIETPSAIEEKKKEQEKEKQKAEAEKKRLEEQKKKEEAKKREELEEKKKEEQKKKAEEEKNKKLEEAKQKEARKKEFEKRLAELRRGVPSKYKGESANAGGEGFGAARIGGKGGGGGTLVSLEKLTYMNALENHVKQGWRWAGGAEKLTAVVSFRLLPDGALQDVRLERGSGNSNFDDSVMRAALKSSPVPAPPARLYADFSFVRITFDSHE